jgi:hypothetical protein
MLVSYLRRKQGKKKNNEYFENVAEVQIFGKDSKVPPAPKY